MEEREADRVADEPVSRAPHRGALILSLGFLSYFLLAIPGFVAWAMANRDLEEMREGRMDPSGKNATELGRLLGILSIVIWIVATLFLVVLGILDTGPMRRRPRRPQVGSSSPHTGYRGVSGSTVVLVSATAGEPSCQRLTRRARRGAKDARKGKKQQEEWGARALERGGRAS